MELLDVVAGAGVALLACGGARVIGFDQDRAFYPTMLVVIATYYVLFAAIAGAPAALGAEALVMVAFMAVAGLGFRRAPWLVVAGLAAHALYDAGHPWAHHHAGVPAWWPGFCLSFDGVAALWLTVLLRRRAAVQR